MECAGLDPGGGSGGVHPPFPSKMCIIMYYIVFDFVMHYDVIQKKGHTHNHTYLCGHGYGCE